MTTHIKPPVSWEVTKSSQAPKAPKSPVQRRLEEAKLKEWETMVYDAPPVLSLPPRALSRQTRDDQQLVQMKLQKIQEKLKIAEARRQDKLAETIAKASSRRRRRSFLHDETKQVRKCASSSQRLVSPRRPPVKRKDFDARISDAETRRLERNNGIVLRAQKHSVRVESKRRMVFGVRKLQLWWRFVMGEHAKLRQYLSQNPHLALGQVLKGLAMEDFFNQQLSFEDVAAHISSRDVSDATLRALYTVKDSVNSWTRPRSAARRRAPISSSSVRVFLSSIMLLAHPNDVLGADEGATPEDLLVAESLQRTARCMLKSLETLAGTEKHVSVKSARRMLQRGRSFLLLKKSYETEFNQWRKRDANKLANEMLEAYITIQTKLHELEEVLPTMDPHTDKDPGLDQMKRGMQAQLDTMEKRVKQLLGKDGLETWKKKANMSIEANLAHLRVELERERACSEASERETEEARAKQQEMREHVKAIAREIQGKLKQSVSRIPSNECMVHEITLNKEYKIVRSSEFRNWASGTETTHANATNGQPKAAATKAMDEQSAAQIMNEQIQRGDFEFLLMALEEIRQRLSALTPNRADLQSSMSEHLDIESLQQQFQNQAFGVDSFRRLLGFLEERVLALQSPVREQATRAWIASLNDTLNADSQAAGSWMALISVAVDKILSDVADIELDMANYHLSVLAANLPRVEAVKYLQSKWAGRIEELRSSGGLVVAGDGSEVPKRTLEWMKRTASSLESGSQTATVEACIAEGVVECITVANRSTAVEAEDEEATKMFQRMEQAAKEGDLPEILALHDKDRVQHMRHELLRISMLGVLEVFIRQILGSRFRVFLPIAGREDDEQKETLCALRDDLSAVLADRDVTVGQLGEKVMHHVETLASKYGSVAMNQEDTVNTWNQVRSLVHQVAVGGSSSTASLQEVIYRHLVGLLKKKKTKHEIVKSDLARIGLLPWKAQVGDLVEELGRVKQLHMDVHRRMLKSCLS